MCGRILASPVAYLVVTSPGRGDFIRGAVCSGVTFWRLGSGEAGCSIWLTRVYFTMIRFVLFNGSRDSVVSICIRVVGM
jgi:hypothetical protein